MRRTLLLLAALLVALPASAQTGEDASKAPQPTPREIRGLGGLASDLEEEDAIRKLYAQYTEAWNRHDVPAMVAFWAIDGDYMEPDGRHAKGRDEVAKLFQQEHQTAFKNSTLALTIETVWFITENVAMVDGQYDLSGVVDLQGKQLPVRKGHLTAILLREDGTWKVAAGRAMIPVPLVYREG
ncbi:MAG TPA: SgcJ/EcaC family oxidoreductase [Candidatus Binatia bacterium]